MSNMRAANAAHERRLVLKLVLLVATVCAATLGCEPAESSTVTSDESVQASTTTTTTTAPPTTTTTTTPAPQPVKTFDIDLAYTGTSGPRVAIIGDSLTVAGRPELFAALSGYQVKIASVVGEGIGGGPWSRFFGHDVLGKATREYLRAEDAPDALVIALGTNNAWQTELTLEHFEAAWPEMVADYRGSCLVAVTATESADPLDYDEDEAALINSAVVARADRVVDWHARDLTGMLQSDHIHLLPAGARHRAEAITEAIESCDLPGHESQASDPETR